MPPAYAPLPTRSRHHHGQVAGPVVPFAPHTHTSTAVVPKYYWYGQGGGSRGRRYGQGAGPGYHNHAGTVIHHPGAAHGNHGAMVMRPRSPPSHDTPHGHPYDHYDISGSYANAYGHNSYSVRVLKDPERPMPKYKEGGGETSLPVELAVVKLVDWLSSEPGRTRALKALETARTHMRGNPDLHNSPFKVFASLDNGLFAGLLSPAVYLNWIGGDYKTLGATYAPGAYRDERDFEYIPRIACLMNWNSLRSHSAEERSRRPNGGDQLLALLIHQMIHAWFLRVCGTQKGSGADGRLKHGVEFFKCLYAIASIASASDDRFAREGTMSLADLLLNIHKHNDTHPRHIPLSLQAKMDEELYDRTICHTCAIDVASRDDVEKWYKKICGTAKDAGAGDVYSFDPVSHESKPTPRHEKPSPTSYIEVLWNGMNFDYKRKAIERCFASLEERFANGKRVWTLPREVDARTFAILDSFLKSGMDYAPELRPMPPPGVPIVVRSHAYADRTRLWTDIRAYKLGEAVQFPELSQHALARLHTDRKVYGNSLDALKEIYELPFLTLASPSAGARAVASTAYEYPAAPDDLRVWARAFMMATPEGAARGGYYASNLHMMEELAPLGVIGLVGSTQNRELEQDHNLVLSALWKVTPRSMHPPGGVFTGGGDAFMRERPVDLAALPGIGLNNQAHVDIVNGARQNVNMGVVTGALTSVENNVDINIGRHPSHSRGGSSKSRDDPRSPSPGKCGDEGCPRKGSVIIDDVTIRIREMERRRRAAVQRRQLQEDLDAERQWAESEEYAWRRRQQEIEYWEWELGLRDW